MLRSAVASAALSFGIAHLEAASILSPVAVIDSDMGESDPQLGAFENMINQSGLDKPFTSGVTDWDTYFTTGDDPFAQAAGGNNWQSETQFSLPVMGYVDFDFGAEYSIDRLAVWNISMKDIKIHVSNTSIATLQEVASFTLPNHLNFPFSYRHDLLDLGSAHDVRYLRIEIESVHLFSPSDTFGFAIVGEVTASAVPVSAGLDGDYNTNGTVDAADYIVWRKNLGTEFDMPNDTTPGDIGTEDFDEWRANFGASSSGPAAATSIPEPAAYFLFSIGGCLSLAVRRPNVELRTADRN
ncbi:MAG TPA: hypothetical protein VGK58_06620 [Lacipirellulaceae bacterium]